MSAKSKGVLFVGHAYYNNYYLSRGLRKLGWKADVLNIDVDDRYRIYYHGEDFSFKFSGKLDVVKQLYFFVQAIQDYDVFHFAGINRLHFGSNLDIFFDRFYEHPGIIHFLRRLGKRIVYTNTGCMDGVSRTAFSRWKPFNTCSICQWRNRSDICSDALNLRWAKLKSELTDFQILSGGNRVDGNLDSHVHEVPEYYCLDENFWHPDLTVPTNFRLPVAEGAFKIYHSVGNFDLRTVSVSRQNVKCTHIILPLVEKLKQEGLPVELLFFKNVPNRDLRYYMKQADVVVDMLTFGWFGANIREAMMLGIPSVCYIRPEWLDSVRREISGYADELPVISATPDTIEEILRDLQSDPEKCREIGRRSREFAVKWHSSGKAAFVMDHVYRRLLNGEELTTGNWR